MKVFHHPLPGQDPKEHYHYEIEMMPYTFPIFQILELAGPIRVLNKEEVEILSKKQFYELGQYSGPFVPGHCVGEITMEKLGVDTTTAGGEKTAAPTGKCPICGRTLDPNSTVPKCTTHGTEPFERQEG